MRLLFICSLILILSSALYASPTVTLALDKTRLNVGDTAVYTSVIAVPTGDAVAKAISWKLTIDSHLAVTEVTGPLTLSNSANIAWKDAAGTSYNLDSAPVVLAISKATLTNRPDASGNLVLTVGDMKAAESETITVKVQRTS